jgi:hypothetical protein
LGVRRRFEIVSQCCFDAAEPVKDEVVHLRTHLRGLTRGQCPEVLPLDEDRVDPLFEVSEGNLQSNGLATMRRRHY